MQERVPWWVRIGAKIVLARLPVPYRIRKQFRVFEYGNVNEPGRALDTFIEHAGQGGIGYGIAPAPDASPWIMHDINPLTIFMA
jgi:hypothetical protein